MAVFYPKNLQRVVRDMLKTKCDKGYIEHYMMEEYKVGPDVLNAIFKDLGVDTENLSAAEAKRKKHNERFKKFQE